MNKRYIIWAALIFAACRENQLHKKTHTAGHATAMVHYTAGKLIKLPIDTGKSRVAWRGTKLMKTGKHEGTVKFAAGELLFSSGDLQGGHFVADLRTIYITDIPLSDPEPRNNLARHLDEDFETGKFPRATFTITQPPVKQGGKYTVTGTMLIKSSKHPLTIQVEELEPLHIYEASFTINRLRWGIGKGRSWLEKKLVDEEILLKVHIETKGG